MGKIKDFFVGEKPLHKRILSATAHYCHYNILFLVFVILCLFNSTYLRMVTIHDYFYIKPLLADIAVMLVFGLIGYFIRPSRRFVYYFVMLTAFSILSFGNSVYYTNFKSFISSSQIATALQLKGVMDAVTQNIMEVKDFVFFLPIVLYIALYVYLRKKHPEVLSNDYNKKTAHKTAIRTFIVSLCFCLIFCTKLTSTDLSRLGKNWNRVSVVTEFGEYTYTFSDFISTIRTSLNTVFGVEESKETFNSFYDSDESEEEEAEEEENKYEGIFEGKNMLVIHAESIQQFLMDTSFNGEEVTPNLNKLASEGLYFSNFYAQESVGTSSDSEFTFSSSLLPASSGTVAVNYTDRLYVTTQKLLKEKGYYTFSMHANNGSFWNRIQLHESLGYDYFYNYTTDYDIDLDDEDQILGMGLNDKDFFAQSVEKIKEIDEENDTWMGTLIMLSNHTPFTDAAAASDYEVDFKYTEYNEETGEYEEKSASFLEGTKLGDYIKSAHYADEAIGELIDELDEAGLLDDTVIVIYGDHDAKIKESEYEYYLNYDPYTDTVLEEGDDGYVPVDEYCYNLNRKVPFIIWTKDQAEYTPEEITTIGGMYDCLPTLGNMFGYESEYALGHDLFNEGSSDNTVILPSANYITDEIYYSYADDEYFDLTDYENVMTTIPVNQQTDYSEGLPVYVPPDPEETEDDDDSGGEEEESEEEFTLRDMYSGSEMAKRYNDGIVDEEYINEHNTYTEQRMAVSDAIIFHDMIRVSLEGEDSEDSSDDSSGDSSSEADTTTQTDSSS
ncbi:MAG: LTA synthase family protein [Ruminococcus sp.]|nr:LTA synthase family protein [Ruminococcus sp.]